jgi:HK97 family phage major capsid protein
MSTIKELREKCANIATEARSKLSEIDDNTPAERAAEIEREFDAMMADHDKIQARAERMSRLEQAEKRMNEAADERRPSAHHEARAVEDEDGGEAITYRQAFYEMLRSGGSPSEMAPEARNVLRSGLQREAEFRAQTAGTTTAGGYTVPTELYNVIIKTMAAWGPMYDENICTTINTAGGNPLDMPTVNDTTVTAEAHTEAAALTDDGGKDVTFGKKTLNAYVFDTEFVRFSMELTQDSVFNMENLLGGLLGERLARISNSQLTTGTGSSAPNGIVTASTAGKTAAAAAAITSDELIDLVHSVDPAYRMSPKVRFMFNDSTLNAIRKLKDGDGNYLWQMGDVTRGEPGSLLGYRYSINQAMADIGASAKPVLFGDFGKYFVRKVGTPVIGVMRERFWPDLGIAGLIRFDGELGDTAAVKHLVNAAS